MAETATRSPAQPAVVLGLTFLAIGLTFALPFALVPPTHGKGLSDQLSAEVLNVYACVAWAGWAHFVFAFRGQSSALTRIQDEVKSGRILAYIGSLIFIIAAMLAVRSAIGVALFGAIVWIYFIDHFIKAEQAFEGKYIANEPIFARWVSSYQALISFTWLSIVLLNVWDVNSRPWVLWGVSSFLGLMVLIMGGWKNLLSGDARSPLLALFFIAEAMVWGTVSRYGGQVFLTGVYVLHIAGGSYFHYFGSYFVANARNKSKDIFLTPLPILLVNIAFIALGYLIAHRQEFSWLTPIFGIQWFTLWVAVHLVSSDVFPYIKAWKSKPKAVG